MTCPKPQKFRESLVNNSSRTLRSHNNGEFHHFRAKFLHRMQANMCSQCPDIKCDNIRTQKPGNSVRKPIKFVSREGAVVSRVMSGQNWWEGHWRLGGSLGGDSERLPESPANLPTIALHRTPFNSCVLCVYTYFTHVPSGLDVSFSPKLKNSVMLKY